MIQWKKIKNNYPHSYKRFVEVMFPYVGVIGVSTLDVFDTKSLFFFFDKENVFLNVERMGSYQWIYTISLSDGRGSFPKQETRQTREEIEIDGFNECFKVLDRELTNIKTKSLL